MRNFACIISCGIAALAVAHTSEAVSRPNPSVSLTAQNANVVEHVATMHARTTGAASTRKKSTAPRVESARSSAAATSPEYVVSTDSAYPDIAIVTEGTTTMISATNLDICTAGEAFYSKFKDDRDMLFVFGQSDSKDLANGYNAYYQGYRNFVGGIGLAVDGKDMPIETECGSKTNLLGIANMNATTKWKGFTAPVVDLWPLGVIAHEIGHQWISYLTKPITGKTTDGKSVAVTLGSDSASSNRGHWQQLVHTNASIMYGNAWVNVPFTKDKWVSALFPNEFTKLDKYLMGITDGSDIDNNAFVIKATKSNIPKNYAKPGYTATGTRVNITRAAIKSVYGTRTESYPSGGTGNKKTYATGFILVVPKGQKPTADALKAVDYFRKRIPSKMNDATDGAFTLTTDIQSQ